jgi:hypothetical protein
MPSPKMRAPRIDNLPHDGESVHVTVQCCACGEQSRMAAGMVLLDPEPEAVSPAWDGVYLDRMFRCRCGAVDQYEVTAAERARLEARIVRAKPKGNAPVRRGRAVLWDGSVCTRPSAALQRLQDAADAQPHSGPAWRRVGNFQRALGDWEAAEQAWRQAVAVDKDELEAAVSVAMRSFQTGARTAMADLNTALERLRRGRSAPLELRHELAEQLVSLVQTISDLHPGAVLLVAWGEEQVADEPVILLSTVRLAVLKRWDRLVELFESDLVVAVRLVSEPVVEERTALERLLNSSIPLALWSPPLVGPVGQSDDVFVRVLRPAEQPRVWRSMSQKKNRRSMAKDKSRQRAAGR